MPSEHHVLEDGKRSEEREVLERASDAGRGDRVRREAEERAALELDLALRRIVEAAQAVEERGLAGAVRGR
jgi:CO dehydrogenase/acetyl-CoA synthase delta subunit